MEHEKAVDTLTGAALMVTMAIQGALLKHQIIEKAALEFAEFIMKHNPQQNADIVQQLDQIAVACLAKACNDELDKMSKEANRQKN